MMFDLHEVVACGKWSLRNVFFFMNFGFFR